MTKEFLDYIEDIIKAMDDSLSFVKDMSYDIFLKDEKTAYAVIRTLEIMGEATKNIPIEIKNKYPQIPRKDMVGMRDKAIHAYLA
jgi:uncharacterized protein with HEPN domain